jgi:hypothetical protein
VPQIRADSGLLARHLLLTGVFAAPFAVCLVLAFETRRFWPYGAACAALAAGLALQWRRFRRYRCGGCGRVLPYRRGKEDEPLEYHCPACDVTWRTGMSRSFDE